MSNSRMVDAVNRLIGDLLSGVGEVFLPGIGSLYVERQGAKRLDKRTIQPPCRMVSFSSQPRGASLVDEIARAAQADAAKATEIYETWLARTRESETLTIEGVGELKFKNFTPDTAFDLVLNPEGRKPVRIKTARRFDWVLWLGVAAILIAAGFVAYQFLWEKPSGAISGSAPVSEAPAVVRPDSLVYAGDETTETEAAGGDSVVVDTSAGGFAQPETVQQPTAAEPAESDHTVLSTVAGRNYVVLGVFSTEENAVKASVETLRKNPDVRCRIYRFGGKFMVSAFEGDDADACAQFIRESVDRMPGLWTYNAR